MTKIIALVGMTGAGKSLIADYLVEQGWGFARFGQITLDIVKKRGLEPNEQNEKMIRESVRQEYGMGAYATLNIPKFDKILTEKNLVADGLYSWSEYKILKNYYGDRLTIIAVYAPPQIRYERLVKRSLAQTDKDMRYRPATPESAKSRDYAEIENIEKGGPIAMADYTILNLTEQEKALDQLKNILKEIL